MKFHFIVSAWVSLLFCYTPINAQFAPPVGQEGTTAMYKDSSAFVAWANKCNVVRGFQDISNQSLGYTNVGDSSLAIGQAGTNGVVSLGDGGVAILEFSSPILDGIGPDFAVFENGFDNLFLELAFVEVSSDGIHFFRFPAISNTDTTIQTDGFGLTDASKIHNLAGKYRAEYGTPFDLSDLTNDALLNKQTITHVKVIDVIGSIQNEYCSRDANNHKINDPWPTGWGNGGFDLDAVGVIHQQAVGIDELELRNVSIYPNPAMDVLYVNLPSINYSVEVINLMGEVVLKSENKFNTTSLELSNLKSGVYFLTIASEGQQKQMKFLKL
ncbi:MAG: T9SS type A sorting domain-containing protein [Bacteroidetes bacterium]|nr:T9SS type A sorting domain-containing protein [Bacteroidota bacterium]